MSPIDLLFDGYPFKTLAALEYAIKKTAADLITFRTDVTQTIRKKLQVFDHFGLDAFEFPKEVAFLAGKNASTSSYYTVGPKVSLGDELNVMLHVHTHLCAFTT